MPKTRTQQDMRVALELVRSLEQASSELKNIYGGLCHSFPVLVRQSGLCQALAFSAAKAAGEGERAQAHKKLLEHVGRILQVSDTLQAAQEADATQYMHMTRRVLEAWVYFKRFAASVLGVKTGGRDEG